MDIWESVRQMMESVFAWSWFRAVCAAAAAGICQAMTVIGGFVHPSIAWLLVLLCVDFIFGAGIALYEARFTIRGFRHGCGKFVAYGLIFIVTTVADRGMGITEWPLNLTVTLSYYAIAGEALSCLRHIDAIFPGRLPGWVIRRLEDARASIERDGTIRPRRRDRASGVAAEQYAAPDDSNESTDEAANENRRESGDD